ncbi:phenylalanine 4-monooxygenase [Novosphingobium pentaromativorans]|uniref:Phenylalanine-4-hydroxylase n=1 Tax=Novosphingobium pentaromativorans US6-1 TaxID=1088721 RepID=G6EA42_9SPHN|nr:phenylalanine 4-monooxygenase [Novosphingobium pentaromativorans]AIT80815.1 phenylalanine-4-hydroxylase [Novosphingobium pentaromativorans US6-1]EHJ61899.1 phenylalanine-4-hydroxylase [Novosphingobium pentaromativorans US6-1]
MKKPSTDTSASGLRGEYEGASDDYTVGQDWHAYTPQMHERWRRLHARQSALTDRYACRSFREGLARLDCAEGIPRFEDANAILGPATGWQLVAVPGFIPDAVFFDHLAHRRFPVTRWVREEHELDYLVEPDVFHDFFGHVPMLLDPAIADFLELYGKAGERAMAMDALPMLARIYWYTIEFGLVREGDELRVFGAGIISSHSETVYSIDDSGVLRLPFDPVRVMRTGYMIDDFQKTYFVLESLPQLIDDLVGLDFGPVYEQWRDAPALPAGESLPGETPYNPKREMTP